jgi:transposase
MKTYPVEFRYRVVALTQQGMKSPQIAQVLGVSGSWVTSIRRLHESGRPLEPKSRANHRTPLAQREQERLRARVAEHPGTTLEDLKRDLNLKDSISNIWHALRALGLSLKKNDSRRRTGSARRGSATDALAGGANRNRSATPRLSR